jgi:hypothetical protein
VTASLDYLVGTEKQRRRYGKADQFSRFQIDHKFEFGQLLDLKR